MHMIKSIVQYDQKNQPQGKENKSIIQGRDSMFRLFCLGYEFTQFHPLFTLPKHNLDSRKKNKWFKEQKPHQGNGNETGKDTE